jgi:hypothetical protein
LTVRTPYITLQKACPGYPVDMGPGAQGFPDVVRNRPGAPSATTLELRRSEVDGIETRIAPNARRAWIHNRDRGCERGVRLQSLDCRTTVAEEASMALHDSKSYMADSFSRRPNAC